MNKFRNIRKNQLGFSLVTVMISMGITMIIATGVMTVLNNTVKGNLNNTQMAEAIFLHSEAYAILRDPLACTASFQNLVVNNTGGGYSNPTLIRRADNPIAFQSGQYYQSRKLTIAQMELGEFVPDNTAYPNTGKAFLNLHIDKPGQPVGPSSITRSIRLQVVRSPSSQLVNCVAIAGTKDTWLLNTDNSIFYPGGSVGIGTDMSQPASLVSQRVSEQMLVVDGKNKPTSILVRSECCIPGAATSPNNIVQRNYAGTSGSVSSFMTQVSHGTMATPSPVPANRHLGSFSAGGYDGIGFTTGGENNGPAMKFYSTEAFTPTRHGSKIVFSTVPKGSISSLERLFINDDGSVYINNPAAAVNMDGIFDLSRGSLAVGFPNGAAVAIGQSNIQEPGIAISKGLGPGGKSGSFHYNPANRMAIKTYEGLELVFAHDKVGGGPSSKPWSMRIQSDSNIQIFHSLGIGTAPTAAALTVQGNSIFNGGNISVGGNISATGTITATSDRRLKKNISPLKNSLEKVSKLNGVSFNYKKDADHIPKELGLIAQDVEYVFPEAVKKDERGLRSVNYMGLIAPILEAIKELNSVVRNTLFYKVERLEEENRLMKEYLCQKDASAPFCSAR